MVLFTFPQNYSYAAETDKQLIIINKTSNELAFFQNGEIVKIFPVATGKTDDLTPEGTFSIVNKIKNRPYYTDNIPGGDPRNPLGDRWLGIDARGTYGTTYAIHGNNNPGSIGKYVSAGCVRMHNEDVHWLFERVNRGTKVIILKSNLSFERIAENHGYSLQKPVDVYVNGKKQNYAQAPVVINGRVLVPMRSIFETLGATVQWDGKKKQVVATKGDRTITLTIGSNRAVINGRAMTLDVSPRVYNGNTLVPARVVAETFGATVQWNGANRVLNITYKEKEEAPKREKVGVTVNGKALTNVAAFLENNTVYVPLRGVFEEMGATVGWKQETNEISISNSATTILLKTNSTTVIVNGKEFLLNEKPMVESGVTYLPVRFVSEHLGAQVTWKGKERHVEINY